MYVYAIWYMAHYFVAYFYECVATVWVGSPPQRKSVIVDTGSHYTAFPCTGCNNCGESYHTDLYFDPEKSNTFHQNSCKEQECVTGGRNCQANDQCTFGQSYAEGSSWKAYEVQDLFAAGGNTSEDGNNAIHSAFAIDFMFGCQSSETGLFITQLADGIMGMSADKATFPKKLFDQGRIPHNMFTMCFRKAETSTKEGVEAGYLSLGGADTRLHTSPMAYARNMRPGGGWYTINIRNVYLREGGGLSALADNPNEIVHRVDSVANDLGKNAIVDSGTTDTYLNRKLKNPFNSVWKSIVGKDHNNNKVKLTNEQLLALPTILFQIEAFDSDDNMDHDTVGLTGSLDSQHPMDVLYAVPSIHYMEKTSDGSYASRLYFTESNGGVLGANSMRGHDILFDWENGRVGFAESDCTFEDLVDNDNTSAVDKESVDCVLGEIVVSSSCEDSIEGFSQDKCAKEPDAVLTGVEILTAEILDKGNKNGKSCEVVLGNLYHHDKVGTTSCSDGLCNQTNSCSINCSDISSYDDQNGGDSNSSELCDTSLWGICRSSCTQIKVESTFDAEDGKCHEIKSIVRPCHTGACLDANPCHIPFKIHVILGIDGGDVSLWTKRNEQEFINKLATVLKQKNSIIEPGDIDVLMTSKWRPSSLATTTGLKVISEISIYDSSIDKEGSSDDESSCPMERLMQVSKVASKLKESLKEDDVIDALVSELVNMEADDESPFSAIPQNGGISKVIESWIIRTGIDRPLEYVDPQGIIHGKSLAALLISLLVVSGISLTYCCVQKQREAGRKNDVHTRARVLLNSMRKRGRKDKVKYAKVSGGGTGLADIDDAFDDDVGDFEMA